MAKCPKMLDAQQTWGSFCKLFTYYFQFIFSTSLDGKIKAWLYDNGGSRFDYTAPGHWCTNMDYIADGTSKEGDSYIVGGGDSYIGFRIKSKGVVQFDTTKNRFLVAGDEFMVKFWDMDNTNLLTITNAGGELFASPRVQFNKLGSLLANADGFQMLRSLESRSYNASRSTSEAITKAPSLFSLGTVSATAGTSAAVADRGAPVASIIELPNGDNRSLEDVKPRIIDESNEKSKIWKLTEISESSQCYSLKLSDNLLPVKASVTVGIDKHDSQSSSASTDTG